MPIPRKIDELEELATPADGDLLVVVDVSDGADGTTKRITKANLGVPSLPLSIANGGTGQTSFAAGAITSNGSALASVAPGTSGNVLTSNGTVWTSAAPAGGAIGSDTQVAFNDAGTMAGDAGLTYNKTTDTLTVVGPVVAPRVVLGGGTPAGTGFVRCPYNAGTNNLLAVKDSGGTDRSLVSQISDEAQFGNLSYATAIGGTAIWFRASGGAYQGVISTIGWQIGDGASTTDLGGGTGVIGLDNATTNPSTNPTNGVVIYADGGAAKCRGAGGTVTTFGPAEPHCPKCGADFVFEATNPKYGHLALCFPCLLGALDDAGVDTSAAFIRTGKVGR